MLDLPLLHFIKNNRMPGISGNTRLIGRGKGRDGRWYFTSYTVMSAFEKSDFLFLLWGMYVIVRENFVWCSRSRHYLNSIFPYNKNKSCLISPQSESRTDMIMERTDPKKTPQSTDQGLVRRWAKANGGAWTRSGAYEKASQVWGIGVTLDALHVRQYANYANSSYNYSIESDLDNTATNVFVFCTAVTELESGKGRQIIAVN